MNTVWIRNVGSALAADFRPVVTARADSTAVGLPCGWLRPFWWNTISNLYTS